MGNELEKTPKKVSLLTKMAAKNEVDPTVFLNTIKATVIKGRASNEQITAFLMVANRYDLDPWRNEIHAFADKGGGVVPIVGVDGWITMAQRHPQFDGEDVRWAEKWVQPEGGRRCPEWCEWVVYRKDRAHPTVVREYLDECYRKTNPWQTHTKRMLRHKAMIQAYRLAFGFSGIYDEDEAQRIVIEGQGREELATASSNAARAREVLGAAPRSREVSDAPDGLPGAADEVCDGEVVDEAVEDALGQVSDYPVDYEEEPAEEPKRRVPKATKQQVAAVLAAKRRGGWDDELFGRLLAEYDVDRPEDLDREQALDIVRHLMAGAGDEEQEELEI